MRFTSLAIALVSGFLVASVAAQDVTEVTISGPCSGVYDGSGYCIDNPTPDQRRDAIARDRAAKERAERDRRERDAKAAERKRLVDAQVMILGGEHRRAEAERYVDMRAAAEKVRPKSSAHEQPPSACKDVRIRDGFSSAYLADEAAARAQVNRWASRCGTNGVSCGAVSCKSLNVEIVLRRPAAIRHICSITATRPYRSCSGSTVSSQ